MPKRVDPKILQDEIKSRIRESYPYFLGFYLLALVVAFFSKTWSSFFYWPAFHLIIIIFTAFFIFIVITKSSLKIKLLTRLHATNKKVFRSFLKDLFVLIKYYSKKIILGILVLAKFCWKKIASLSRTNLIKIFIIIVVLIFSLYHQIEFINFLILVFGLISVLFAVDNRWSAGAALIFLAACPFLLITKNDILAEKSAIFAYYLLVISVLTMIHESMIDKANKVSQ